MECKEAALHRAECCPSANSAGARGSPCSQPTSNSWTGHRRKGAQRAAIREHRTARKQPGTCCRTRSVHPATPAPHRAAVPAWSAHGLPTRRHPPELAGQTGMGVWLHQRCLPSLWLRRARPDGESSRLLLFPARRLQAFEGLSGETWPAPQQRRLAPVRWPAWCKHVRGVPELSHPEQEFEVFSPHSRKACGAPPPGIAHSRCN